MGWFCESPTTPTTSTQTQSMPAWYEDALQRLVAGGEAEVAAKPYTPYPTEERVAPLSQTEEAAIAATPGAAGAYMPGLSAAFGTAAMGSRGIGDVDFSQYMNPYTQNVVDIQKREALRDYGMMRPQMGFQASKQGAFGGARHGVVEAEAERNLGQRLGDIQQAGQERAFNAATGLFTNEAQRQLQAAPIFSNIGSQSQQLGLGGLDAILKSQAIPRGLEQQRRDLDFQEYMRGQGYGMNQLGTLSGLIRGVQPGGTTVTQGQVAGQSPLATAAGLGLAGAGIYNLIYGRG
jgi:hypothetical protein